MNTSKWVRNKITTFFQSLVLVASLAAMLGLLGWLFGGPVFAVAAAVAVAMLYFLNPMVSPVWTGARIQE